ncbi:nucleotide-sugar transporter-domain-containing protein [Exophiala viscosa]|uniref:nucleotide-sugar transporter-domain-containing protein n=1 Tax=Exophiala viscosa TaxID=2486360 RepID=UPI00219E09E8|nr:nucleotide-sugar transporter-domain-containing protein [Exophiala viscosa]
MFASTKSGGQTLLLLPAYVLLETIRAILTYTAIHSHVPVSSTCITFGSELGKLTVTTIFLCRWIRKEDRHLSVWSFLAEIRSVATNATWKSYLAYAVPSLMYLANNLLYLLGLELSTPATLHITVLAKLPITAILHHFLFVPQRNFYAWLSLAALCVGLVGSNVPLDLITWIGLAPKGQAPPLSKEAFLGPIIGLMIAVSSAGASIYMEFILKQPVAFWVAQFWLYSYSVLFSGLAFIFWDGQVKSAKAPNAPVFTRGDVFATPEAIFVNLAVIVATATTGLVVANILRKQDNLVKLIGTSLSIVTIIVGQWMFFPALRAKTFNVQTVAGAGIIAISVWTYHYYKQAQPRAPGSRIEYSDELDSDSESSIPLTGKEGDLPTPDSPAPVTRTSNGTLTPTLPRVAAAISAVVGLSMVTAFFQQPQHLHNGPFTRPFSVDIYGSRDVERFFVPNNVTPAVWGQTRREVGCIKKWIKSEHITPDTQKFNDWEYSFLESGCPVYPIPDGGMIFHQYWNGPWRPFQEITIDGFLATQRLGDGHRLIYWYEEGGPTDAVRAKYTTGEYGKYVEFRELNRTAEAKGTCLENMREWADVEYQKELEMKKSTSSDLVRNMLLAKYGGVWLDSDTIPLVDFTPMIRSGPSVPALGGSNYNNDILVFGPAVPDGPGDRVLHTTCEMPYNHTLFVEKFANHTVKPVFWYWLYNDGLFKLCSKKEFDCGLAKIPVDYTDGYAFAIKGQEKMKPCGQGEEEAFPPGSLVPVTLRRLWAWHNRMGHRDDECVDIEKNTLIGAVRRRIREVLSHGLKMEGQDLFPGPSVLSRKRSLLEAAGMPEQS